MKLKRRFKVLIVIGPRPEVIKLAPIFLEFRKHKELNTEILLTGQHRQLTDQAMKDFGLKAKYDLNLMKKGQGLEELSARIFLKFGTILKRIKPDLVIAEGDTTTTAICSICCYYQKIPFAHVEAGLRSFDKFQPFPEEINRMIADIIADLHFAPTNDARENLIASGIDGKGIFVTGNTVIDSLLLLSKKNHKFRDTNLNSIKEGKPLILVTMHRRESFGRPIKEVIAALKELNKEDVQIVYPVHLNPNVKGPVYKSLSGCKNIILTDPLNYLDFINLMKKCSFILTDSGGVQEEAPTFGKPILVLRNVTERPEGVKAGIAKLVGTNRRKILRFSNLLLNNKKFYSSMAKKKGLYGAGDASKKIVKIVKTRFLNSN
ncbi:MAG TPA: UDP-N-acetylglucosamine 2-epimerase (non-hydrolyzing) [Nanoarchaeota archaeon]|nr:UDP-N-acetylglucosamine 2-epimerase (non-hydrolyzing) [Nanoarchaeota archaeon]HIH34057.1 UDP-N-acetylglucosamine 2-epimerase (non-hydrolyzing) [Nanoarchaeota archaeon]HIH51822.1 UDP-N-acetylglucosamine 2-epimerase (non-hydrolyzing) [Nanoarchaeota archaeon]HIH66264.1 UDP-N-acetylglucosamine 2-epimerase (non-hydrolyzing) [Nanoarchaeota archaeon]